MRLRGYSSPWAEALIALDWSDQSHASLIEYDEDLAYVTPSEYCLVLPVVIDAALAHGARLEGATFVDHMFSAPEIRLQIARDRLGPDGGSNGSSFDDSMRAAAAKMGIMLDPNWEQPYALLSPLDGGDRGAIRARLDQGLARPDFEFACDFDSLRRQLA